MQHKGLNTHRFASNPKERIFAEVWQKVNDDSDVLAYILDRNNRRSYASVSERDVQVAATVIQWLGSPVGEHWLGTVLEKIHGKPKKK